MQSRYSVPSPFTYNPVAPPANERGSTQGNDLWPLPSTEAAKIMEDVNRWLNITEVNGQSFFEIRLQKLNLSLEDQKIARLTEQQILRMDLNEIKQILPTIPDNITELREARLLLFNANINIVDKIRFKKQNAEGDALDDQQNLTDFIDFLKENVFQHVANDDKKNFLAKEIAHNFHQSGFPVAASMYYQKKSGELILGAPADLDQAVRAIFDPPMKIIISCDEKQQDQVTFHSLISYQQLNTGKSGDQEKALVDNITNKRTSFVDVESKIHIKAEPDSKDKKHFKLNIIKGDDISIQKKIISVMSHEEIVKATAVNTFLSKLFDDPLSGNKGIYLQKNAPDKKKIEPQQTYLYFDGSTLKYMAKDYEGKLLQGKISNDKLIQEPLPPLRTDVLTNELKGEAESKSLPVVVINADKDVLLYSRKKDGTYQYFKLRLSANEKAAFEHFHAVGVEGLTKKEYNKVNSIINKYHTPLKSQSPRAMMSELKSMATASNQPRLVNKGEQNAALQSLFKAASTLEYTTPPRSKSFSSVMSNLFLGRKKEASPKVKPEAAVQSTHTQSNSLKR